MFEAACSLETRRAQENTVDIRWRVASRALSPPVRPIASPQPPLASEKRGCESISRRVVVMAAFRETVPVSGSDSYSQPWRRERLPTSAVAAAAAEPVRRRGLREVSEKPRLAFLAGGEPRGARHGLAGQAEEGVVHSGDRPGHHGGQAGAGLWGERG